MIINNKEDEIHYDEVDRNRWDEFDQILHILVISLVEFCIHG